MTQTESLKAKSEAYMTGLGLGVNVALPCIEEIGELIPRNSVEVAQQYVALSYLIRVGHGYPISQARERLLGLGISDVLGSETQAILRGNQLSDRQKIDLTWQVEGAQVIAWALGLAELDHTRPCDDDLAHRVPFGEHELEFIQESNLRPISDIQEQVDLIYRMHWYVVNCRFTGSKCGLNESVIRERRRALDWIYGVDEDWDEIPLDT